jgi:predicted metal-dependent phosphotriesterase family hydrolase
MTPRLPPVGAVQTVRGPVAPGALGVTHAHEHLWCDQRRCRPDGRWRPLPNPMRLDEPEAILEELVELRALGVGAIVEATVAGWGRDVERLRAFSEGSGLHVVAASGYYVEPCLPDDARTLEVEALAERLVTEVTRGCDGTAIRPGVLKSAISRPAIEGVEERAARAVARAHRATGLPITTHTSATARFEIPVGTIGPAHLDLFESEGVEPGAVIIGHVDENADARHLEALARRGAFVQFDVIGKEHFLLDATRARLLLRLVERGVGGHLLLSTDRARPTDLRRRGGLGYRHLLASFVPRLRAAGMEERAIHRMLVENPARAFRIRPRPGDAAP